VVAPSS